MQRQPGQEDVALGLELTATLGDFGPDATAPPALSIELTDGPLGIDTFRRFRQVTGTRYPTRAWPAQARYQWGSWYVYGPGVDAAGLGDGPPQGDQISLVCHNIPGCDKVTG